MRALLLLSVLMLGASGCASRRPVPSATELLQKRLEVEVLRQEMDLAIRSLDTLQQGLIHRGDYTAEAQDRDLDYIISVVRQARDKVTTEDERLHRKHGVSYGPY